MTTAHALLRLLSNFGRRQRASWSQVAQHLSQRMGKWCVSFVLTLSLILPTGLPFSTQEAQAARGDRTLYLYYTHTRETARIRFRKNGKYDRAGLKKLNYFLRDWRHNEPIKMDPRLFDLIWAVYQEAGGKKPIHVVSAYRSPKTNKMLRSRSRGVAKNSQHTKGKAMDYYIPGVKLSKLRSIGLRMGIGGVGYYPRSGSPFVHMDTGSVRHWPRMSRKQLVSVFPKGRTLHVPTDRKPLKGYKIALAEQKRRQGSIINTLSGRSGEKTKRSLFAFNKKPTPNPRKPVVVKATPNMPAEAVQPTAPAASIALANVPLPRIAPWKKNGVSQPSAPLIADTPADATAAEASLIQVAAAVPRKRPTNLPTFAVDPNAPVDGTTVAGEPILVASAESAPNSPTINPATDGTTPEQPKIITARLNIPDDETLEPAQNPTDLVLNTPQAPATTELENAKLAYAGPIPQPRLNAATGTQEVAEAGDPTTQITQNATSLAPPVPLVPLARDAGSAVAANDLIDSRFVVASVDPSANLQNIDLAARFKQSQQTQNTANAEPVTAAPIAPAVKSVKDDAVAQSISPRPRPKAGTPTTQVADAQQDTQDAQDTGEKTLVTALADQAKSVTDRFADLFSTNPAPVPRSRDLSDESKVTKSTALATDQAPLPQKAPAKAQPAETTLAALAQPELTTKPEIATPTPEVNRIASLSADPMAQLVFDTKTDRSNDLMQKNSTRQMQFAALSMPNPAAQRAILSQPMRSYRDGFVPWGTKRSPLTATRFSGSGNKRVLMKRFGNSRKVQLSQLN